MGKSLKLRFARVIASFNSCRSKDPSSLPQNPNFFPSHDTNNKKLSTKLISPAFPLINQNQNPSHVAVSVGCGKEFKWQKEEKFHVVSSSFVSEEEEEESEEEISLAIKPPTTPPRFSSIFVEKKKKKKQRVKKTKTKSRICRMSTSSAEEYSGILSGTDDQTWDNNYNEEEETETLVSSSKSFDFSSDDSSTDFNPQLETICETTTTRRRRHKRNATTKRRLKHSRPSFSSSKGRRSSVSTSSESELPARLSVFKKLIPCSVDGKVKESFAIVKKSQDPYEDFKRSMMEMIMEKQMFEKNELEQLLQCFLSLNGKHYHGVIVEAFSNIWETLFLGNGNDRSRRISTHLQYPQPFD